MNVVLLIAVVSLSLVNNSVSQSSCVTPNGENGLCIPFERCGPFIKIWNNRTSKNIVFFKKSHCGFLLDEPLVCCGSVAEFVNLKTTIPVVSTTEIFTSNPVENLTDYSANRSFITPLPIPITSPQLFTSAIVTNTPPATQTTTQSTTESTTESTTLSITQSTTQSTTQSRMQGTTQSIENTSDSTKFQNHKNFNLLPDRGKCGIQTVGEKITNGNETDLDEYPWLAMLLYRNGSELSPNCGGTLINSRYVLTAAHCIKGDLVAVRLGEYNITTEIDCVIQEGDEVCADPYQQFAIEDFVLFNRYSNRDRNRHNDIALIRMKDNANITDYVRPICLPLNNERSSRGQRLTVAGWGLTENNATSEVKLFVNVPLWSDTACQELYSIGYRVNLSSSQLCAGGQDGKDSCTGDSGGPLMRPFPGSSQYYMEGIVSFGPAPCGRQATPGVYVRVTEYVEWILDNMQPF